MKNYWGFIVFIIFVLVVLSFLVGCEKATNVKLEVCPFYIDEVPCWWRGTTATAMVDSVYRYVEAYSVTLIRYDEDGYILHRQTLKADDFALISDVLGIGTYIGTLSQDNAIATILHTVKHWQVNGREFPSVAGQSFEYTFYRGANVVGYGGGIMPAFWNDPLFDDYAIFTKAIKEIRGES